MVSDIGLVATARRVWVSISFRLKAARYLTARGQYSAAIDTLERKLSSDPLNLDLYFASGGTHHARGSLSDAVAAWAKGMEAQAELARAGISSKTRYLGTKFTRSIGHTAYFDTYAKRKPLRLVSVHDYIVLADHTDIGNAAYVDCWRNHFEIITDPKAIRQHLPTAKLAEEYPTVFSLGGNWRYVHDVAIGVENRWIAEGRKPLLTLTEQRRSRARVAMEALGLPRDHWFVALHVREGPSTARRNGILPDYLPALRHITNAGGWVVLIGDPSMAKLPALPNVIDYAHGPRKDWLDVYILAAARFVIGTNSGPAWAAGTFGVPALLTNWAPLGVKSHYRNTILLPQRLWLNTDKRYLTPDEEIAGPLAFVESTHILERQNISPVFNSPEQIVAGVDEMMRLY